MAFKKPPMLERSYRSGRPRITANPGLVVVDAFQKVLEEKYGHQLQDIMDYIARETGVKAAKSRYRLWREKDRPVPATVKALMVGLVGNELAHSTGALKDDEVLTEEACQTIATNDGELFFDLKLKTLLKQKLSSEEFALITPDVFEKLSKQIRFTN